uniref:Uncharacterized protein n=1 Tax=Panagrolaimus sp. PS1159 TaxID=55785 RepID=A0AC35FN79_9BILA
MYLFRNDIGLLKFKLQRGAVKLKEVSTDSSSPVYDLIIETSNFLFDTVGYDLQIRIRCIKNTKDSSEKGGVISEEEEEYYESYAQKILDFCRNQRNEVVTCEFLEEIEEEAFQAEAFNIPNITTQKVFKQKITDLRTIIDLICNPHTGSYSNVLPSNTRLYLRVNSYLSKIWQVKVPRIAEMNKYAKNYTNVHTIQWNKVNLSKLDFKDIQFNFIEVLEFENMRIYNDSLILHPFFQQFDFKNLKKLKLTCCYITNITDELINLLPSTLIKLDLHQNDISEISSLISKFVSLEELDISENENLKNSGIPWKFLPSNIIVLRLLKTNISEIPDTIPYLEKIKEIYVGSEDFNGIAYNKVGPDLEVIKIEKGSIFDECKIPRNCNLRNLIIQDTALDENSIADLQNAFSSLSLKNPPNDIGMPSQALVLKRILPFLKTLKWASLPPLLTHLTLDNNGDIIADLWSNIPVHIPELYLNGNNLKILPCCLKILTYLQHLHVAYCNLSHICFSLFADNIHLFANRTLNILSNNDLESLPFVPLKIHQPAKKKDAITQKHGTETLQIITDNKKLFAIKFPMESKMPKYTFATAQKHHFFDNKCYCCAECGRRTDEPIVEQVMAMDCGIYFFENNGKKSIYHAAGNWNGNIRTRSCASCLVKIKNLIKDALNEKKSKIDDLDVVPLNVQHDKQSLPYNTVNEGPQDNDPILQYQIPMASTIESYNPLNPILLPYQYQVPMTSYDPLNPDQQNYLESNGQSLRYNSVNENPQGLTYQVPTASILESHDISNPDQYNYPENNRLRYNSVNEDPQGNNSTMPYQVSTASILESHDISNPAQYNYSENNVQSMPYIAMNENLQGNNPDLHYHYQLPMASTMELYDPINTTLLPYQYQEPGACTMASYDPLNHDQYTFGGNIEQSLHQNNANEDPQGNIPILQYQYQVPMSSTMEPYNTLNTMCQEYQFFNNPSLTTFETPQPCVILPAENTNIPEFTPPHYTRPYYMP